MISNIKVYPFKDAEGPVKAFAQVEFGECFVVGGIKVIQKKDGEYFIGMPSRKDADGEYHDIAFPVTADFRETLQEAIIAEYEETVAKEADSGKGKGKYAAKGKESGRGKAGKNTR